MKTRVSIAIFVGFVVSLFILFAHVSPIVHADQHNEVEVNDDAASPTDTPSSTPSPTPTPTPTLSPSPTPISENTFSFPSCAAILPKHGDRAHFETGLHQIIGGALLRGSDDVFSLDQGNVLQCFCPPDGTQGIQTDWLRTDKAIEGWFFVNGEQWDLGDVMFAAQNSNFVCSSPNPSPSPSPSPTPTPTPTPPTSPGMADSIQATNLTCGNQNFDVIMTLTNNGSPVSGVLVRFSYQGVEHDATTQANGNAQVGYSFQGENSVTASPEGGYPSQALFIHDTTPSNCSNGGSNGSNGSGSSGGSSQGQILSASTTAGGSVSGQVMGSFASTGVLEDTIMNMVGLAGAGFTLTGSVAYAKKRA